MDVEASLLSLGKWSRWHIFMFLCISSSRTIPACWHSLNTVFMGLEPSHHCQLPDGIDKIDSIPLNDDGEFSKCEVYVNYSSDTNDTMPCPNGWTYGDEVDSIVNKWDLVCDRSYLVPTSHLAFVVGTFFGSILGSILSDKYGRKRVLVSAMICINVAGLITAFSVNIYMFFILRFVSGFLQLVCVLPGFILICELFPKSERMVAGSLSSVPWSFAMAILALEAYFIRYWSHLLLVISFPGVLAIPLFWVIPESVQWLYAKGRIREAKLIINKAANFNGITLADDDLKLDEDEYEINGVLQHEKVVTIDQKNREKDEHVSLTSTEPQTSNRAKSPADYNIFDIFKSKTLVLFVILYGYQWCVNGATYYGLSLIAGDLSGDPYLNFFLSGMGEIPGYCLAAFCLKWKGRRMTMLFLYLTSGTSLMTFALIQNIEGSFFQVLRVILPAIGKLGAAGTYAAGMTWISEAFPTTIRNTGVSLAAVGGRIGVMLAPYASLAAKYSLGLPSMVFAVINLIACLTTFFLPETHNRPLPTTIEEVESWPLLICRRNTGKKGRSAEEITL